MRIGALSDEVGIRSKTKIGYFTTARLSANGWEDISAAVYCTLAIYRSLQFFPAQNCAFPAWVC